MQSSNENPSIHSIIKLREVLKTMVCPTHVTNCTQVTIVYIRFFEPVEGIFRECIEVEGKVDAVERFKKQDTSVDCLKS